jgi:hypothetical protein
LILEGEFECDLQRNYFSKSGTRQRFALIGTGKSGIIARPSNRRKTHLALTRRKL